MPTSVKIWEDIEASLLDVVVHRQQGPGFRSSHPSQDLEPSSRTTVKQYNLIYNVLFYFYYFIHCPAFTVNIDVGVRI
jgi:hypothetical protein